jgi:transcriptional regulator with XRE-family HTH domain
MAHSIGKTIAELRKEKGWTQVELAEKLQVSDKAVSKWEKDDAFPSVEFFPVLAQLFGVSIDYLMTGKKEEPKVVTMSKAELCAKNNKPKMVREIDCMHRDENGKTLIDYIVKYECLDVFIELCSINKNNISKFKIVEAVKLCILSNRLDLLNRVAFQLDRNVRYEFDTAKDILSLLPEGALEHFGNKQGIDRYACILPETFFKMLLTDKRINKDTFDFLLGTQTDRRCVWYHAFPYLIHQCYENGNREMLSRLLTITKSNNDYAYSNLTSNQNYAFNYFFIGFYNSKNGHGLVRILEKTTKLALDRGEFDLVSVFNEINSSVIEYHNSFKCYVASSDEIRIAKLKLDKSVSSADIAIQSTIHGGIVCIKELEKINDFNTIKRVICETPIHELELLNIWIEKKDWRTLFRYSVDNNLSWHKEKIASGDFSKLGDGFVDVCWKPCVLNQNEFYYRENNRRNDIFSRVPRGYSGYTQPKSLADALELIKRCKQRIIDDLALKMDKDKTTGELTREYFETLLAQGDMEMLIIKLCVRLEAILRCDYHYEGDFVKMIDQYCSTFNAYDDEGNDYDPYTPRLLHKLRMMRNGIVHSEKCNEKLSISELQECINYICKIG